MATEETLAAVLDSIKTSEVADLQKLKAAHQSLKANLSRQATHRAGLVSLVLCAETAIRIGALEIARQCLDEYYLEARRYAPAPDTAIPAAGGKAPPPAKGAPVTPDAGGPLPPQVEVKDQWLVRAHLARGLLASELSKAFKGQALIDGVLEAAKHILAGLEVAAANPRYLFLVYNASVHYWRISRPLQRDGLRQLLLPSYEQVVLALEKVPGQEEWKARCFTSLAMCLAAAGKAPEAGTALQKAFDLAGAAKAGADKAQAAEKAAAAAEKAVGHGEKGSKATQAARASAAELQLEIARLQAHYTAAAGVGAAGGKGAKASPAPPPPPKPVADAKGGKGKGGASAPTVQLDEEGALRMVQAVLSANPRPGAAGGMEVAVAEQQLRDAVARVDPAPDGPAKAACLRPVSRAAWAAALIGLPELAEKWASRAAMAQDTGPRTWSELVRVHLSLAALGAADNTLASNVINVHVRALDALEDIITTFTKLGDVEGVHAAARMVWNAGLLLLQPDLRRHVKRAFNAAARALAVTASPAHRLRTCLHLEAAKCDAAEDALIKAAQEVAKAAGLDYVASPEDKALASWLERPLDRYIDPLHLALALRTTAEPSGPEEEAVALVERSRESRSPAIKLDLLGRALHALASLTPLHPPEAATPAGPVRSAQHSAARRRTLLWGELMRSAATGGLHEVVRAAAPHALGPRWGVDTDREMVVLQARLSLMEAEACLGGLKASKADVAPSASAVDTEGEDDPLFPVGEDGLRLPATSTEQMAAMFFQACLRTMVSGVAVKEPWLVINGAVTAYNAYLPLMGGYRYAELRRPLQALLSVLLQLAPAEGDAGLAVAMAEACAKASEHQLLLAMLASQKARAAGAPEDDPSSPDDPLPNFSASSSKDYLPLPQARVAAAALRPANFPGLKHVMASLEGVSSLAAKALAASGSAPSQSLSEIYTRLQQLRGVAPGAGAGPGASAAEQTSRVVAIIGSLEQLPPRSNGTPMPAQAATDLATAQGLLAGLPGPPNIEMWAKLARAAASAGAWPAALECARAAAKGLPEGSDPLTITEPADAPDLAHAAWFWLGAAQLVQGQAVLALVNPASQDMLTQASLRRAALEHMAAASRFASFVGKADLVEAVCRAAWNAALPLTATAKPLLRAALLPVLGPMASSLNKMGAKDKSFHSAFACMYVECLASARRWSEAVAACDAACKALGPKHRPQQRPLLGWKAACLAYVGQSSGISVASEMTKMKEQAPDVQAFAWGVLAAHSPARYDQGTSHVRAGQAVEGAGWLKAQVLAGTAEWLLSVSDDKETAEDVLLSAADALMEFDTGDLDGGDGDEEEGSRPGTQNRPGTAGGRPVSAGGSKNRSFKRNRSLKGAGVGGAGAGGGEDGLGARYAPQDPNAPPDELGALHIERMMRLHVMLSLCAGASSDQTDYLVSAHSGAVRLLTQALNSAAHYAHSNAKAAQIAAVATAAAEGKTPPPEAEAPLPSPVADYPDTLIGWGRWWVGDSLLSAMQADADAGSQLALSPVNLPQPELSLAYIDLLCSLLVRRGLHAHCLGLRQLQRLVSKLVLRSDAAYVSASLALIDLLDELGLSAWGAEVESQLPGGMSGLLAPPSASELALAAAQADQHALVVEAAGRLEAARGRGGPRTMQGGIGRLSFLGGVRRGIGSDPSATIAAIGEQLSAAIAGAAGTNTSPSPDPGAASITTATATAAGLTIPTPPLPSWLEEAARDMGGGDLKGQGPGSLLGHVNGQLLLAPLTLHDAWLARGAFLAKRGHYAAARDLLSRARAHAAACCHREAEARACIALSRCEAGAANYEAAVELLTQAQTLGCDMEGWAELLVAYCDARLAEAPPGTFPPDVREALQGGVAMFLALARDDRAAERDASVAGAALRVRLSRLLLGEMALLRSQGVASWRKSYDNAVTLVGQAIMALGAREAGIPHVEALLVQAELLLADPAAAKDLRPRFKKVEKVLQTAEELASRLHAACTPRDLDPSVVLPVARLLARCRVALGGVSLAQAQERDRLAAEDRKKSRPKYPKVKGAAADENVVVEFIDNVLEPTAPPSLPHEETALTLASSASNLVAAAPADHARAQLLAGRVLLYQYMAAVPPSLHPGREFVPPPPPAPPAPSVSADGTAPPPPAAVAAADGIDERPGTAIDGADAAAAAAAAAGPKEPELPEGYDPVPVDALHSQAATALRASLEAALKASEWETAESAALELSRAWGQNDTAQAGQYLALAHACRSSADTRSLLLSAAPSQQAEALMRRAAHGLEGAMPVPRDSPHYKRLTQLLAGAGVSTAALELPLTAAGTSERPPGGGTEPEAALLASGVPGDLRLLLLHLAPAATPSATATSSVMSAMSSALGGSMGSPNTGMVLYAAAYNIPDPSVPPPPPEDPKAKKAKGKDDGAAAAPAAAPKLTLLASMPLAGEDVDGFKTRLRTFRRGVERHIRDAIEAAAAKGIGVPKEVAAGGKGAKGKAPAKPAKPPSAKPGAKPGAKGAAPPDGEGESELPPIFDSAEHNGAWSDLLDDMSRLLDPLAPLLASAVPPPPPPASPAGGDSAPSSPAPASPKKGAADKKKGKGGEAEAGPAPPEHKLVLLLDRGLDTLPWEALPALRDACASLARAPSLHALAASAAAQAAAGESAAPAKAPAKGAPTTPAVSGPPAPVFDTSALTYLVDARHECSDPATQARGPYMVPLVKVFSEPGGVQATYGAGWTGLAGSPNRAPPPEQCAQLLAGASGLLFLGVGRFGALISPAQVACLDLRGCEVAMLFDRCNTQGAHWTQVYRDNRKPALQRALESPATMARLLLARGVKTVVLPAAAAPPQVLTKLVSSVMGGLSSGQSVGEAVMAATRGLDKFELSHVASNLQVWGVPGMLGQALGTGKGAPKKK